MANREVATIEPALAAECTARVSDTSDYALRVLGLEKTFRSGFRRRRIPAVRGISFVVPRGSICALLGHNGAGKSTTLNCILDLVHPSEGQIDIFGVDHRDPRARARVGFLPEQPNFYEYLSARELLLFYCRLLDLPGKQRRRTVDRALDRVSLLPQATRKIRTYSKGMRQRLGLAQALLDQPDLLILDEPMSGLDPLGRREVRELIRELKNDGTTVLLSSHIVPDVEVLADTVLFMGEGHLRGNWGITDEASATAFDVRLACLPDGDRATRLLAACDLSALTTESGPVSLRVPDADCLAELLAVCRREQVAVLAVDTHRTDLEQLFVTTATELEEQTC